MRGPSTIDEQTRIPIGLAVGAGVFVCMLVLWAGRVEWAASATAENTKTLAKDVDTYKDDVRKMKTDILIMKCHFKIPDPACLERGSRSQ